MIEFLAFSEANPSSIQCCFDTARHNARSVRGALTSEMWEAINSAWLDLRRLNVQKIRVQDLPRFLNLVKETSLRYDGSAMRTMLRNDAYWFSRLGVYVERADNTARVLDVKYHVLLPQDAEVGGGIDYYQWAAILRSVSALVSYQWVYHQNLEAVARRRSADFAAGNAAGRWRPAMRHCRVISTILRIAMAHQGPRRGSPAPPMRA